MTTYSGFWNGTGDRKDYRPLINRAPLSRTLGKLLSRRQLARLNRVIDSVTSDEVARDYTEVRVKQADTLGNTASGGGKVTIEQVTTINEGDDITQKDIDDIRNVTRYSSRINAVDKSGNGGGDYHSKTFSI